jgi:small neutral amino acid transporter SnatA (MarC family)
MDLFFHSFAGLSAVVGPGKAGIVLAERAMPLPRADRRLAALHTVLISTVVGLFFVVAGDALLKFFHIGDAAFLSGAGLVVMIFKLLVFLVEGQFGDRLNPIVFQIAGRVLGVSLVALGVRFALNGVSELGLLPA